MQGSPIDSVSVYRPDAYRLQPSWKVEVVESATQVFRMVSDPLHMDEQRASFPVRAPGQGVLLQPQVFLEARFQIQTPGRCTYDQVMGPILQAFDTRAITAVNAARANETYKVGYTPKVCFSQGDAMGKSMSSYQITINGASISNSRQTLYKRSLDQCWFSDDVFQCRFGQCGGRSNDYKVQPVSGSAFARSGKLKLDGANVQGNPVNYPASTGAVGAVMANQGNFDFDISAGADPIVVAFTGDRGTSSRIEGFMGAIEERLASDDAALDDKFVVVVRWPVTGCGLFNACVSTDDLAPSCPYRQSMLALAHCNQIQLDILWTDMVECLFRNLSGRLPAAGANNITVANAPGGVKVRLMGDGVGETNPQLLTTWLRLPSWRGIPRSPHPCSRSQPMYRPRQNIATRMLPMDLMFQQL